jgi:hypothetical protein
MWFKVEQKRSSVGQKFVVRCNSEIASSRVVEERAAQGAAAARKTAEILASTLNVTATVYGTDANGEFVYGVYEVAEGAAAASSPLIKRLFAESAAASLTLKDQLLADIPEDAIKGFASLAAALGYIVAQHKQIKRATTPQISYSTLFRIFCGAGDSSTLSLSADDATIALLTRKLEGLPEWMWLSELPGVGVAERAVVVPVLRPNKVTLNIDGELQVIRPRTVFRGTVPESGAHFMLIAQVGDRTGRGNSLESIGLVYKRTSRPLSLLCAGCSASRTRSKTVWCLSIATYVPCAHGCPTDPGAISCRTRPYAPSSTSLLPRFATAKC